MLERVTAAEHTAGRLDTAKLQRLQAEFERNGFVTLSNVVPDHAVLAELEDAMDLAAAVQLLSRDFHTSRTQLGPLLPRSLQWVRSEISANPVVEHMAAHLLGGEGFIRWHGSNTALPMPQGAERPSTAMLQGYDAQPKHGMQHLHMDGYGWSVAKQHPTYKLFVNFAVSDMTPERGSTQLWPASHTVVPAAAGMPCDVQQIDVSTMEPIIAARADDPNTAPIQIVVPRGGAMFRDLRCWHRGMPNFSNLPRHMLGCAYGAVRDPGAETSRLGMGVHDHTFNVSCAAVFNSLANGSRGRGGGGGGCFSPVLQHNIKFVPEPVDANGRTAEEEGFSLPFPTTAGTAEKEPHSAQHRLLSTLLQEATSANLDPVPWWVMELVVGRRLERDPSISGGAGARYSSRL